MKDILRKAKRKASQKETAYITKRILIRATNSAGKKASTNAMKTAGYLITVEEGWVVKITRDGSKTKLSKLATVSGSSTVHLD